ncbi:MAG: DNA-directed RNA polymerase subunit G [Aeropyrum sp.]|nr:DNA-directed RNA polymerase subunit G [Aeropyrum sp.]MCE4616699.1 DNA-directed RNA polymerase subunit G [Aeropyrum sp.]
MNVKLKVKIEEIEPGRLQGQRIASGKARKGPKVKFDVIDGLLDVGEGDTLQIEVISSKPESLDDYEFCGHGYKVPASGENVEILSIWGILFAFEPPIGLEEGVKYYVCISRQARKSRKPKKKG